MPSDRRRFCQVCGKHDSEVGSISWRGKCFVCGHALMWENAVSISRKEGFPHEWRLRGYERMIERARLAKPPTGA